MQDYIIENNGLQKSLVIPLSGREVCRYGIGVIGCGMAGVIAPVSYDESKDMLKYDISRCSDFSECLSHGVTIDMLISVMETVICAVTQAEEHLLDMAGFELQTELIFTGDGLKDVRLIYVPVKHLPERISITEKVENLFRNMLTHATYADEKDGADVIKIFNYLNDHSDFSLTGISGVINRIKQSKYYIPHTDNNLYDEQLPEVLHESPAVFEQDDIDPEEKNSDGGIKKLRTFLGSIFVQNKEKESEEEDYYVDEQESDIYSKRNESFDATGEILLKDEDIKMPYLVSLSSGQKHIIDKDIFCIGKEDRYADLRIINNASVSRMHAEITIKDGLVFITDQDSVNHTYVNGNEIPPYSATLLRDKDIVSFADDEYEFRETCTLVR